MLPYYYEWRRGCGETAFYLVFETELPRVAQANLNPFASVGGSCAGITRMQSHILLETTLYVRTETSRCFGQHISL